MNITNRELSALIGAMDQDELRTASAMIKSRWNMLQASAKAQFYVGQKVQFYSKKHYGYQRGVITSMMQKNVKVSVPGLHGNVTWTVSPNLLQPVKETVDQQYGLRPGSLLDMD